MNSKHFGGKVTKAHIARYEQSPNWSEGSFQNLEPTSLSTSLFKLPAIIYKQLTTKKEKEPKKPIPVPSFDEGTFVHGASNAKFIWYGHSAVMMRIAGKNILIDPMLGPDTAPIAPIATKRFSENTLDLIDQFPEIDLILMTHDHYDHLDWASINELKHKTKHYIVALGVKRHLERWGVDSNLIEEMDWWENRKFGDISITFTPTRHFSGRGLTDRLKCLWGGWALHAGDEKIWFSGDGGYGGHFKEVGARLGPFDFAFMECGQYNEDWRPIHLFPDEAVQAAIDAKAQKIMPVHWAGFALSYQHTWYEPAEVFIKAALEQKIPFTVPRIGEEFDVNHKMGGQWWNEFV